jgi:hypothetical protein
MQCDKKSLLAAADASNKRNLMAVGGHADNAVELCGEDSADGKRQCLDKGQTMLTKPPSQAEFQECWSEAIIKCGLSPSVVYDPLFRKALVTIARMGQSAVCMGKGAALVRAKYPHVQCFTCPAHALDGYMKNMCGSKEEIQMQRNEMGGVGVQHVAWDEDFC